MLSSNLSRTKTMCDAYGHYNVIDVYCFSYVLRIMTVVPLL